MLDVRRRRVARSYVMQNAKIGRKVSPKNQSGPSGSTPGKRATAAARIDVKEKARN